jgi:hypothetical protein
MPKYPYFHASTATMNIHPYSRCHYKRNSGSTLVGMNNLHIGGPTGRQTPGGSPPTTAAATTTSVSGGKIAAATASGQTLLLEGPRPRPHTRGEDKAVKAEEPEVRPQVAPTISSMEKPSLAATTSAPTTTATCPPTPHQQACGRPKAHRQVLTPVLTTRTRTRTGPSQNTSTALTTYDMLCSRWRREGLNVIGPHTAQPTPVQRTGSHAPPQRWKVAPEAAPEPLRPRSQTRGSCQLPGRRTPLSPDRRGKERAAAHAEAGSGSPRLAPPFSPARMMKILEAKGRAEAAAWLASPHHRTGGHHLG